MDSPVANKFKANGNDATVEGVNRGIEHVPLLSASIVTKHAKDLVPQFGFLGTHADATEGNQKISQNTNVPFSAFICGVQGSGKSHTTACMLENAFIPSKLLAG